MTANRVSTSLKFCRLDDPIEAEYALGALVPPGRGGEVLEAMYRIAGPVGGDSRPAPKPFAPAMAIPARVD